MAPPPPFACASAELDYPIYAVDFDPEDSNRLVVGGGGGAGRSGVGNKITVLETVSKNELRVAGEADLSRDEDSVMSLAVGPHKGKSTFVFAGVNSSPESIAKGTNEHLRTLAVEPSKTRPAAGAKVADANVSELSRSALFSNPDADTYQRLLRVAGPVGAAATAMGKEPQLAIFDAAGANPKIRGVLDLPSEAEDLDIIQKGDNEFQVVFCYKYELHVVNIGKENSEPERVFLMPEEKPRPAFRSVRYLTPNFVLAAANLPGRSGVVLYGLRLPTKAGDRARFSVTARISRSIAATALAVANLAPPPSPTTPFGETQFLVAVAGSDSSISLFTLTHHPEANVNLLIELWPVQTLKDVHGTDNITGVAFSTFITPKTHTRDQVIKLASVSLQKTVAVHTIPLKKFVSKSKARRNKNAPPRPLRYVSAVEAKGPSDAFNILVTLSVFILIVAFVGQFILELYGATWPILGARDFLIGPDPALAQVSEPPAAFLVDDFLAKLSGSNFAKPEAGETLVVFESDPLGQVAEMDGSGSAGEGEGADPAVKKLQLDVHDSSVHGPGKKWEELGEKQKAAWKERLQEAGAWTQDLGESVFKSILFGELAGAVGRGVAGG